MTFGCDCADWKEYIPTINAAFVIAKVHGNDFPVKTFVFCPYCGRKLEEKGR